MVIRHTRCPMHTRTDQSRSLKSIPNTETYISKNLERKSWSIRDVWKIKTNICCPSPRIMRDIWLQRCRWGSLELQQSFSHLVFRTAGHGKGLSLIIWLSSDFFIKAVGWNIICISRYYHSSCIVLPEGSSNLVSMNSLCSVGFGPLLVSCVSVIQVPLPSYSITTECKTTVMINLCVLFIHFSWIDTFCCPGHS